MVSKPPCPPAADLKRLLEGDLADTEQTGVSRHLDTCPVCQQQLQDLAADDHAWDALAGHLKSGKSGRRDGLQEVMEQLRGLDVSLATHDGLDEVEEDPLTFLDPPLKPRQLGKLDQYEIIEVIGRGGMGIVFKALDPALHRIVAIKVMAPQFAAVPSARGRFLREARATAAVCHEHVVTIHAVDEAKGLPYLVMQFVSGVSLQDRLEKRGDLQLDAILRIGMQMAQGLAAAHAQGLVHRDIKPANILLENGVERVKITDFGLARVATDARITQSGVIVGTPQYMAPEQASGDVVDHRADLFSFGSVLYFMCTRRPPFQGISTMAVIRRVCEEKPPPIQEVNPKIPSWLVEIIARLHAKEPANRFQTAVEVAELLNQRLLELQRDRSTPASSAGIKTICLEPGTLPLAMPVHAGPELRKGRGRKRLVLIATLCLVACFAVVPVLFQLAFPTPPSPSNTQEQQRAEDADDVSPAPLPDIPPPQLAGEQRDVKLVEPFAQVRTGGGGRYLVFHLKKAKKLAIVDVSAVEVIGEVPLKTDAAVYACGRNHLMIVEPGNGIIHRIDFQNIKSKQTASLPQDLVVLQAVMGGNSRGPLLLWTKGRPVFFDIERMQIVEIEGAIIEEKNNPEKLELRVSADGQTFVSWTRERHPEQYSVMRLVGRRAVILHSSRDRGFNGHWALPSADASLFFHSGKGANGILTNSGFYSASLESLAPDDFQKDVLLPTEDPRFFLALRTKTNNNDEVVICNTAERRGLLTIRNLEKMTADFLSTHWGLVGGEPRIHYLPSAKVLLTLPQSKDRVLLRPLDLFASVDPQGRNELFVLSVPRRRVRAKTLYDYPLVIHSKAGGVGYKLENPPDGMTVSPDGRIHWEVPANRKGQTVPVIVTIQDASDKHVTLRFDITVE